MYLWPKQVPCHGQGFSGLSLFQVSQPWRPREPLGKEKGHANYKAALPSAGCPNVDHKLQEAGVPIHTKTRVTIFFERICCFP